MAGNKLRARRRPARRRASCGALPQFGEAKPERLETRAVRNPGWHLVLTWWFGFRWFGFWWLGAGWFLVVWSLVVVKEYIFHLVSKATSCGPNHKTANPSHQLRVLEVHVTMPPLRKRKKCFSF